VAGAIIGSGSAYLSYKMNKWINKKRSKKEKYFK
jgi:NAD/NADP transhydrogenase beta subunit